MNIRNFLKATLTAIVLTSTQTYAQESRETTKQVQQNTTITIRNKKYQITLEKRILDDKGKQVTDQTILRKVILTHLINQNLQSHQQTAQNNLTNLNKSKTSAQLAEIKKKYKKILTNPIENIVRTPTIPLLRRLTTSKALYRGAKDTLISIYVDPKMYLYSDITSHLTQAQRDYRRFISLSKQGLTDYNRATRALDLLVESEYIILAATASFQEIKTSNLKVNQEELDEFIKLLEKEDTKETIKQRQTVCDRVRSRARKTKQAKNYISRLLTKPKSYPYQFQQKLKKQASKMFYSTP